MAEWVVRMGIHTYKYTLAAFKPIIPKLFLRTYSNTNENYKLYVVNLFSANSFNETAILFKFNYFK